MADLNVLREMLSVGQVLEPGTEAYSKAGKNRSLSSMAVNAESYLITHRSVHGNLNYRMTMPAAVVQVKSIEDVQATIVFARQNKVRLTVKNGGHSYMGYCLNEGGIVIDMSPMKGCYIDYDQMTIKMQGGLVWTDAYYKYLKDPRDIVIGGLCPTVGVSGFVLGGGLSPFSRSYGLACDNLLQMTVVTYDGKVVTVSKESKEEHERDLFWALSGGGGGNFGVTVDMTCKIHKLKDEAGKVVCGQLSWNLPQQKEAFDAMMDTFNTNKCPDELTLGALWTDGKDKQLTGGMTVIYNGGWEAAQEVLAPLPEGWDPFSQVYHHHASFIFAEGAITPELTNKISGLVKEAVALLGVTNDNGLNDPKCHVLWDHIGAASSRVAPHDTAFFWRQGHYVSTVKVQWTDPSQGAEMMDFIVKWKAILLPYAIDQKAAYLNYIDGTVSNWQEAYYGQNYPRLQKVKQQWDPENFFWNMQSIEPLEHGISASSIPGTASVSEMMGKLVTPEVKKVEGWWEQYAHLATPDSLGSFATEEEVFKRDAEMRREILKRRLV